MKTMAHAVVEADVVRESQVNPLGCWRGCVNSSCALDKQKIVNWCISSLNGKAVTRVRVWIV